MKPILLKERLVYRKEEVAMSKTRDTGPGLLEWIIILFFIAVVVTVLYLLFKEAFEQCLVAFPLRR